jgi:hypothetical protein
MLCCKQCRAQAALRRRAVNAWDPEMVSGSSSGDKTSSMVNNGASMVSLISPQGGTGGIEQFRDAQSPLVEANCLLEIAALRSL